MHSSQTPILAEIAAGHSGPEIPPSTRAYFQQRLRNRIFNFLLEKFAEAQKDGLTKAILARRIGRTPDIINRWLGIPSNLTTDSISDLLLGIAAEELEPGASSPLKAVQHNYSHAADLMFTRDEVLRNAGPKSTAESAIKPDARSVTTQGTSVQQHGMKASLESHENY